ncbi:multidrug resistance protein, MATE family [Marinagarivorans cellulosilyticus]|uniref:Multidrug resistance protein, MATE family n=2 Tax=Marinagarivorans cellulosilyticus TaxID=2721545 RepID=A0AAN1WFL3_9GAMM|nr:multidrug resistance protein, MATE family [Marinagarivorans cellulosilyticus]
MLANTALPLLGLIDTAIIGHWGGTTDLAALAIGSLALNVIFWNFGFLRMSTTGFIAQAEGRQDDIAKAQTLIRATVIALSFAALLLLCKTLITQTALSILAPPFDTHNAAFNYINIRLWAAPASLINYVVAGYLIGLARNRILLILQVFLNSTNALLDILLVRFFDMGIEGIAIGTVIAEYSTAILSLCWLAKGQAIIFQAKTTKNLWYKTAIFSLLKSNRDIWLRTLFLLAGFIGFTHFSGHYGSSQLAANHILLQIISFSAFFLDGFANVTEAYVGKAIGQKNKKVFSHIVQRTSVLACITAIALGTLLIMFGQSLIAALTDLPHIQTVALAYLPFAAVYIAVSCGAFQLDGIFIGAGASAALRNASILSTSITFCLWLGLLPGIGMKGLWLIFVVFVVLRSLFLGTYLPQLIKQHFPVNAR